MIKKTVVPLSLVVALATTALWAEDETPKALKEQLARIVPGAAPSSVKKSPIEGVYEVAYGTQILYMSADGRYLIEGDLIDIDARKNLTSKTRSEARKALMAQVKDEDTIIFAPAKDKIKHTVTVFTDIDCPYCAKLHSQIKQYNDEGIAVRYMLYPRAGLNSPSYKKAVDVWCADDQKTAMTQAKQGKPVPSAPADCKNPVKRHMEIAHELGVTGTPAIVLDSGDMIPGYRPPKDLAKDLARLTGQ